MAKQLAAKQASDAVRQYSMTVPVKLMPPAERKLNPELVEQVRSDIARIFPEADIVCVYDILEGYQPNQARKLVMAVETRLPSSDSQPASYQQHVVKLGERAEVGADVEGWHRCTDGRPMSRRIFVPVWLQEISGDEDRVAVIYRDAAHWYGLLTPQDEVATLAWAVDKAVFSPNEINLGTVERVIRQVLSELGRSFYRISSDAPDRAKAFYLSKLRLDRDDTTVSQWQKGDYRLLRRDVDWLLCGGLSPASDAAPEYVDAFDFVQSLLWHNAIPDTLVGPGHGDLHAENVVVGVSGDEVEYPLLIDYGDMATDNVIAWDFVKLEMELKVRLLGKLFSDATVRDSVFGQLRGERFRRLADRWSTRQDAVSNPLVDRTQQIAFAFEFERRLAEKTEQAFRSPRSLRQADEYSDNAFDRTVAILQSIRRQAAAQLGLSPQRSRQWRNELDAALAIYGVSTIKFSEDAYPIFQRLFAVVSGGVAAARLTLALQSNAEDGRFSDDRPLTYHEPLRPAYRNWKSNSDLVAAEMLLSSFGDRFNYAVPFVREHALLKARLGRTEEARKRLESITVAGADRSRHENHSSIGIGALCGPFLEIEVLSRLGRIYKDKADSAWEKLGVDFGSLENQPPVQFYDAAHEMYLKAYELSQNHYPGGNAAVTALLCGKTDKAREVAEQVLVTCNSNIQISELSSVDRYWVFATEGDMALLLGRPTDAASFYGAGLGELSDASDGIVQATYDQLCRLHAALGGENISPVLDVFRDAPGILLQPGPMGDCGNLIRSRDRSMPTAK